MARRCEKWGFSLWIFEESREIGGVLGNVDWSVIGHHLSVGAAGKQGKAQEWCSACGKGWKVWEIGVGFLGHPYAGPTIWVPHLRRGLIAPKVGHRAKARSVFLGFADDRDFRRVGEETDIIRKFHGDFSCESAIPLRAYEIDSAELFFSAFAFPQCPGPKHNHHGSNCRVARRHTAGPTCRKRRN